MNSPNGPIIARRSAPLAIAVADDVLEIQELAREWLTSEGHSVVCASTGRQLAQIARAQHFDVVITDILMPDADGLEVIGELKRTDAAVRIVAMSGGGHAMNANDYLRIATRLGADTVLPKPFNRSQLMQAIDRATAGLGGEAVA